MFDADTHRAARQPQPRRNSATQMLVDALQDDNPESSQELAKRLGMPARRVDALLYQRANFGCGGVYRLHGKWYRGTFDGDLAAANAGGMNPREARAAIARLKKASVIPEDIRVAQPRTSRLPAALTLDPHQRARMGIAGAPPMRPGADDHKRIPSLYGDHRVAYKGFNSISPTTHDSTVSGLK